MSTMRHGENLSKELHRASGCLHEWLDSLASEEEWIKHVHAFPFGVLFASAASAGLSAHVAQRVRDLGVSRTLRTQDKSKMDSMHFGSTRYWSQSCERQRNLSLSPAFSRSIEMLVVKGEARTDKARNGFRNFRRRRLTYARRGDQIFKL